VSVGAAQLVVRGSHLAFLFGEALSAYYNEHDPYAAEWLRNLIVCDLIADGEVDERSIEDVRPRDVRGFTQCHFFAGVGVWSLALRRAGWDDSRPVWTGSCPCQPFSSAGKGGGMGDERHLWPAWNHLISECRPPVLLGEQVASKNAEPWLDLVHTDLETLGYAFGAVPFPAASVGAPHIRDRLYWVAYDNELAGRQGRTLARGRDPGGNAQQGARLGCGCVACSVAHSSSSSSSTRLEERGQQPARPEQPAAQRGGDACGVGDSDRERRTREHALLWTPQAGGDGASAVSEAAGAGPTRGFWAGADWIPCRDGKARPVEPGTFPLAHGAAARVGRLRAFGNAIVEPQAEVWIKTVMECVPC
jgi:DNA (cytosine-5)-methyltransferase 1